MGVLLFSFTLPATRLAVPELGGSWIGFGRIVIAGSLALLVLVLRREKIPDPRHWKGLVLVALGVVFGFPVLTSFALQTVPSSHGAVVVGLLPAATAIFAVLMVREKPRPLFWGVSLLGVVAVLIFAVTTGAGHLQPGDLLMLLAVLMAAMGYAEGGRLAREMDGWRVVSWALTLSLPFAALILMFLPLPPHMPSLPAWMGFFYVSVISMFLGFFAWYRGLALGGVARAGQVQLVQPVLTVVWSALLLGEKLEPATLGAALLVVGCAALSRITR